MNTLTSCRANALRGKVQFIVKWFKSSDIKSCAGRLPKLHRKFFRDFENCPLNRNTKHKIQTLNCKHKIQTLNCGLKKQKKPLHSISGYWSLISGYLSKFKKVAFLALNTIKKLIEIQKVKRGRDLILIRTTKIGFLTSKKHHENWV